MLFDLICVGTVALWNTIGTTLSHHLGDSQETVFSALDAANDRLNSGLRAPSRQTAGESPKVASPSGPTIGRRPTPNRWPRVGSVPVPGWTGYLTAPRSSWGQPRSSSSASCFQATGKDVADVTIRASYTGGARAFTLGDTVVIDAASWNGLSPQWQLGLLVHEITHSVQYDANGFAPVPRFLIRYTPGGGCDLFWSYRAEDATVVQQDGVRHLLRVAPGVKVLVYASVLYGG